MDTAYAGCRHHRPCRHLPVPLGDEWRAGVLRHGTCGLVGQIGVYTGWVNDVASGAKAAVTGMDWLGLVLISFVLPAVLTWLIAVPLRKWGWIKDGDLKLDL